MAASKTWTMGVNLVPNANGNELGNTTNKWVVNGYTLADACAKGVTDNSSSTAASSTDTNLVTGRTLYYALDNAGVAAITNTQIDNLFA